MTFKSQISFSISSILFGLLFAYTHGATFDIINNCPFTVWAAALPGGGTKLDQGQYWTINVPRTTGPARIWARTGCTFNATGQGKCQSGDCNGVLECKGSGAPPVTVAEYALNQINNLDFFDMSLVDGFNVPMEFSPTSAGCRRIICNGNINQDCPNELRVSGGCYNACYVYKIAPYCCTSGPCASTLYSRFFKDRCPDTYSYPMDDQTSTFTCPTGTNYRVRFCPNSGSTNASTTDQRALVLSCF